MAAVKLIQPLWRGELSRRKREMESRKGLMLSCDPSKHLKALSLDPVRELRRQAEEEEAARQEAQRAARVAEEQARAWPESAPQAGVRRLRHLSRRSATPRERFDVLMAGTAAGLGAGARRSRRAQSRRGGIAPNNVAWVRERGLAERPGATFSSATV